MKTVLHRTTGLFEPVFGFPVRHFCVQKLNPGVGLTYIIVKKASRPDKYAMLNIYHVFLIIHDEDPLGGP